MHDQQHTHTHTHTTQSPIYDSYSYFYCCTEAANPHSTYSIIYGLIIHGYSKRARTLIAVACHALVMAQPTSTSFVSISSRKIFQHQFNRVSLLVRVKLKIFIFSIIIFQRCSAMQAQSIRQLPAICCVLPVNHPMKSKYVIHILLHTQHTNKVETKL